MKRLIPFILFVVITMTLDDNQVKVLKDRVPDVKAFLEDKFKVEYSAARERLIQREIERSRKEETTIPGKDADIIQKAFDRPDYKDAEEKIPVAEGVK